MLFANSQVVGTFKGFNERGLEFAAEIVAPYDASMLDRPQLGQFLLIELGSQEEAALGRITRFVPSGLLATAEGEDYCSAPLKSSHLSYLLRPILDWASIAQRLMRTLFVVPPQPVPNDPPRILKRLERVLPDTFLFETPKEPFDDPILFRRVRRDELLLQPIVPTGLPEPTALKDQAIVAAEDRCGHRTQGPKSLQARRFDRPFRLLRPTAQGELIADHFPIMTVDHRREMRPAILPTGNMRYIHGPAFVAVIRPTRPALHARAWGGDALMHKPPVLLQHTIDGLPIDAESVPESQ